MKLLRIANGQGFWGDSLEAPVQLVERGPIDYLTLDYLGESVTDASKQHYRNKSNYYPNIEYTLHFSFLLSTQDRTMGGPMRIFDSISLF